MGKTWRRETREYDDREAHGFIKRQKNYWRELETEEELEENIEPLEYVLESKNNK